MVAAIEDHGYVILNAIGPIGVAVFLTFVSDWWSNNSLAGYSTFNDWLANIKFLILNPISGATLCTILTISGAIGQAKDLKALKAKNDDQKDKIARLESEKLKLSETSDVLEGRLRVEVENNYQLAEELIISFKKTAHLWTCQIFNEMAFTVKHRISIYYLDAEKKNLVLLDRFAKNYEFNLPGRPYFSRDQGVIGKAWADGEYFEKKIPLFNRKNTNYYQYLEDNYGFSRDISSRLRMKSCTIGGFAIEDVQGHHVGVIIFESQDQNDFDDSKLRELVKRENHRLVEFISDASARDMRPLPSENNSVSKGGTNEQKVA